MDEDSSKQRYERYAVFVALILIYGFSENPNLTVAVSACVFWLYVTFLEFNFLILVDIKAFWNFITKTCRKIYLNYFYRWPPDTYQGYLNTNNLRIKNQECSICL